MGIVLQTKCYVNELLHDVHVNDFELSNDDKALAIEAFKAANNPEGFEVRAYQDRVGMKMKLKMLQGHRNILLTSATGSGKTFMMAQAGQRLSNMWEPFAERLNLQTTRKKPTFGFTCMRPALVHQAQDFFKAHYPDIFPQMKFFSYFSNLPERGEIDILFEDEAQHSASDTASSLFDILQPSLHIGCTATDYRSDRLKLAFSTTVKDAGIRQLINEGYLSKYHQYMVNGAWTPEGVAQTYINEPERWGKSVMFFLNKASCYKCAELVRQAGLNCEVVVGGNTKVQDRQIEMFHQGKVDLLINAMVLTEGFDAPELETVFIRPGSKGPTIQMAGRALRKYPGQDYVNIVQCHNTKWNFSKTARPEKIFDQSEEDSSWTSKVDRINDLQKLAISNIIKVGQIKQPPEPQFLKKHRKRQTTGWNRAEEI